MVSSIFPQEHEQACPGCGSRSTHRPPSVSPPIFLCPIASNGLTEGPSHPLNKKKKEMEKEKEKEKRRKREGNGEDE